MHVLQVSPTRIGSQDANGGGRSRKDGSGFLHGRANHRLDRGGSKRGGRRAPGNDVGAGSLQVRSVVDIFPIRSAALPVRIDDLLLPQGSTVGIRIRSYRFRV